MPIPTPFHTRTGPLCHSFEWRNWSGYLAAGLYEPTHEREYYAIRNSAALIDVSPLFKYDVTGPDARRLLNRVMTRDIGGCAPGRVMYTPWCDEAGKLIDDGTVACLDDEHFRVTAADPSWRWLADCGAGLDAQVTDVSADLAALALQGPNARRVLARLAPGAGLESLGYYRLRQVDLQGVPLTVTRTGYTGDLGYELWVPARHASLLWDAAVRAGEGYGLLPAGMVALDIARIEAGLLLIEVDYISSTKALIEAQKSTPYDVGLGWAVALNKGPFIGRAALRAAAERGPAWRLVGLDIDWPALEAEFGRVGLTPRVVGRASRVAVPVYMGSRQVGQATSSTFSPILKRYIALATVLPATARPGTRLELEVTVEYERRRAPARVVPLPFFDPPRKKADTPAEAA